MQACICDSNGLQKEVYLFMKYHLHVNQERALALGISNINQAIILDLLCSAPTWAQAGVFNGEVYYWVARQKVCSELKILNLKPDTVYRHLVALHKLGLIDYQKDGKRDLIRITKRGASYYVGNGSEETRKQIRESSEINPTDPTTIDPLNQNIPLSNGELISKDYKPQQEAISRLRMAGYSLDQINNPSTILKFICYYEEGGRISDNWDLLYVNWVINERVRYNRERKQSTSSNLDDAAEEFLNEQ